MEFDYKCPLCGEAGTYELPVDAFEYCAINTNALIRCKCPKCLKTWVKYAYVVFGEDKECGKDN